ncbi:hypothetical protein, partial [Gilliamella sp. B14448G12]
EFLLLAWQAKLLLDNNKTLQKTNLTEEQQFEIKCGLALGFASILLNTLQFIVNSTDKLAKMAGNVSNKLMIPLTNKAAVLSQKTVMKLLISYIKNMTIMARALGAFEGIKEIYFGLNKINAGFKTSGRWQFASGAFLLVSMGFGSTGIGIALSVVCIVLSVFCAFMSELTSLTSMERWFDRCYFGLNQLTGNLSPYPLTEDGIKKLIHGFYGASRGYELFLTKKSQKKLIIDYGDKHDIYLNVILPNYKPDSIRYYGSLIVEKKESSQNELIGHNLTGTTFKSTTSRDSSAGSLSTLEMKVDFTNQTSQLSAKNQLVTYKLDEQGSLIICPVVYVADDNIDTKISVLGFIEEQNGSETPFTIELEDYIDI